MWNSWETQRLLRCHLDTLIPFVDPSPIPSVSPSFLISQDCLIVAVLGERGRDEAARWDRYHSCSQKGSIECQRTWQFASSLQIWLQFDCSGILALLSPKSLGKDKGESGLGARLERQRFSWEAPGELWVGTMKLDCLCNFSQQKGWEMTAEQLRVTHIFDSAPS